MIFYRPRYLIPIALLAVFSACKQEIVPEPYKPRTEFAAYKHSLSQVNLLGSALGRDWLSSSENALSSPNQIETPFKEAFYLDPARAEAVGYRFSVKRGQKIEVSITKLDPDSINLFIDLYRVNNDSLQHWQHVASADSLDQMLAFEPRRDADYILRLQPELLRGGRFGISIINVPSFQFPVTGKDSKAVGSYFGDPRDGGKRDHHGVDIFAGRHTPIIAPTAGYIRRVTERGLGGNIIWLRDSKGHNLYFAHLQKQLVEPRTYVNPGDTIGTVGNTGNARTTPPHLHFGIYRNGPIDPIYFIKETNTVLPSIQADLATLGTWVRTKQESLLMRNRISTNSPDTLEMHSYMKVTALSGSSMKIMLPNGESGFVDLSETETISTPVAAQSIDKALPLLSQPLPDAFPSARLVKGEELSLLAKHDQYWYVRTSNGDFGWIDKL